MNVKVKKVHEKAIIPEYQSNGAACVDLVAVSSKVEPSPMGLLQVYDTGLAFEIPENHVGLVFPRSSVTTKTTLMLGNGVGVIDSDYRGTIKFQYRQINQSHRKVYEIGDRIGQLMILPAPIMNFIEVDELSNTERGEDSFGSTDVKNETEEQKRTRALERAIENLEISK